ncbi:uncharacterized protein V1518DRAFT_422067 [Limtongia smithiae]|uniref:uncharacterized protein n=1 Tax=Limtongia smithiae TaxID=1125753 RepID=UPI0034D009A8
MRRAASASASRASAGVLLLITCLPLLLFLDAVSAAANLSNRQSRDSSIAAIARAQQGQLSIADLGRAPSARRSYLYSPRTPHSPPLQPASSAAEPAAAVPVTERRIDDWKLSEFLLIATVDGSLHACDRDTGDERWVLHGEGSVVRASPPPSNYSHRRTEDDVTWIVEPFGDGALYYFTPKSGLHKLPISIKDLVSESPSYMGDDKVYTGSRQTTLYSIDARTGKVLHVYGGHNAVCPTNQLNTFQRLDGTTEDDEDDDNTWNDAFGEKETFVLGYTEYRLQITSTEGGRDAVVWNVTYSTWGPNNGNTDLIAQYTATPDNLYIYALHDGSIVALNIYDKSRTWYHSFSSPAIATFDVFSPYRIPDSSGTELILLPQPKDYDELMGRDRDEGEVPESMSTFLDCTHDGGWYALSEQHFPDLVKHAPAALWNLGIYPVSSPESYMSSLVGVHDSKRTNAFKLLRIDAPPPASYRPQIDAAPSSASSHHYEEASSLALRALADVGFALSVLVVGYLFLMRKDAIRDFWRSKKASFEGSVIPEVHTTLTPSNLSRDDSDPAAASTPESTTTPDEIAPDEIALAISKDSPGPSAMGTMKKRKRGARGGRRNGNGGSANKDADVKVIGEDLPVQGRASESQSSLAISNGTLSLNVTDEVLGYGSHGTVVYRGTFENREVAVKRLLLDFYDFAAREVSLLQESDDHPNVVRYFCRQESEKFLYIALELCPATLQDVVDRPDDFSELTSRMDSQNVLYQIASGLKYLHSLKIVHRDIKPQNILVAPARKLHNGADAGPTRLLISDFGLCKKLDGDQSSFYPTTPQAAGTSGWRAPELLVGATDFTPGSTGSSTRTLAPASSTDGGSAVEPSADAVRVTRAIDIFSLGCVFYYILSNGLHPYGDRYLREANIVKGEYDLKYLEELGYAGVEACDLIKQMLDRDPAKRPTAVDVLMHPYFWSSQKRLNFLLDVSDRFEIEQRDPPSALLQELESDPKNVVHNDWYRCLDRSLIENLGKYRKYHTDKVLDLLRALRNKKHHYQDLPANVQQALGPVPEGFLEYFSKRFPSLLMHVYYVVKRNMKDEMQFRPYFEL